jgi:hypothetical protein
MVGEAAKLLPMVVTAKAALGTPRSPSPARLIAKAILRVIPKRPP